MATRRMEDCSLKELADFFLELIQPRSMARGTVVALSAGGHLAKVGSAAYAWDLVEATNTIKKALPPTSFVAHWPIMFSKGVGDMATIRAMADVYLASTADQGQSCGGLPPPGQYGHSQTA